MEAPISCFDAFSSREPVPTSLENALSGRAHLLRSAPAMPEAIDVALGVGNRRILIGPGEADFQRGEWMAADHDRLLVRAPDPGVPQPASGLERLDVVAIIKACHEKAPRACSLWRADHEIVGRSVKPFTR